MFYSTPETGAGKNLTPDGMTHVPESGAEFIWRRFLDMCHGLKAQNCLFALMCHCTKRTSQHADNIMNSSGDNVRFTANMIGGVRGTLPPPCHPLEVSGLPPPDSGTGSTVSTNGSTGSICIFARSTTIA